MNKLSTALAILIAAPAAVAQCGLISPTGTSQNQNGVLFDGWTATIPLGFSFTFDGVAYTDMYVSDHGLVALNNAGVPAAPTGGSFVWDPLASNLAAAPCPMIAPYWTDHNLQGGLGTGTGEIYVDNTSGTFCTVTWLDVETYNTAGTGQIFSFSVTLHDTGIIDFNYDDRVNNDGSTFGALNAVVGVSAPGATPTASADLSSGTASSTTSFLHEEFTTTASGTPNPNFDLATSQLQFIPTMPGWVVAPNTTANCATIVSYGRGCNEAAAAVYEELPIGGFDITSGTTISFLRTPTGYIITDAIPGTLVPPTAAAQNVAPGALDGEGNFPLSGPMPIPGGTTNSLMITTKCYISLTGISNGVDYTPTGAEFLDFSEPTIAPMWHDFNQTAAGSGLILFEEVGGIAYATWDGVYSFGGSSLPDTLQVQFEIATGNITIVYHTVANDGDNYLFGFKGPGVQTDPGATDISASLAATIEVFDSPVLPLTLTGTAPVLGANWDLTTSNIDPLSPITITFFSDAPLDPGLPMTAVGFPAPGCDINIASIIGDGTGINIGGSSVLSVPLPATPALAGLQLAAQSLCLTTSNPFNLLSSNGILGTLGN